MRKLFILGVLLSLTSCKRDRVETLKFLKEKYPDATIMSTTVDQNTFYIVDSIRIRRIGISRWNPKMINELNTLYVDVE